jgi:hAT family C-terminal dimerisation region
MSVKQQTALSVSAVHSGAAESAQSQISQYLAEIQDSSFTVPGDAFDFWKQRRQIYKQLAPLAEDLLAAPASQAYVERIFSLCGILTAGRRNRMRKSLEMRVCLKLNKNVLTG